MHSHAQESLSPGTDQARLGESGDDNDDDDDDDETRDDKDEKVRGMSGNGPPTRARRPTSHFAYNSFRTPLVTGLALLPAQEVALLCDTRSLPYE